MTTPRWAVAVSDFVFAMSLLFAAPVRAQTALSHLDLDLRVQYERRTVGGVAELTLRNAGQGQIREVTLLLNRLMRVRDIRRDGQRVPGFTQGVVAFTDDSARKVNEVRVPLRSPLVPGDSVTLRVSYAGVLAGYAETGTTYIKDHVDRSFTIIREDAYAFPVVGQASWAAFRAQPRRDFTFVAKVRVPVGQVVAASGIAERPARAGGDVIWSYRSNAPVPFLNITIAPYGVMQGPGARVFHFEEDSLGARRVVRAVTDARRLLTEWYGTLVDTTSLAIMEIPRGFGSQASLSGGIIQTQDAFRDPAELRQLYHELSHLWNAVDVDVAPPRWNEGLATFLQYRISEALDGWTDWTGVTDQVDARIRRRCGADAVCDSVALSDFGRRGITDLSYSVG